MKRTILTLAAVFVAVISIHAYPISPRPLRKLVMESKYIVVGHVREVNEIPRQKRSEDQWNSHVAIVDVIEQIQGKPVPLVLHIGFPGNMICPAPPRYEANTDVLVFLGGENEQFSTHALSYGLKTLSLGEIVVYKARIKEMQEILTIQDKDTQFMKSIEWLVRCAENPVTCHEGTYELSPGSDFMSFYDQTEDQPFRQMLTESQRERLKMALFSNPRHPDLGLVDMIYPGNESEVFNLLLTNLKDISKDNCWFADSYMSRILLYKRSGKAEAIFAEYSDIQFEQKEEQQMSLIAKFVKEVESLN